MVYLCFYGLLNLYNFKVRALMEPEVHCCSSQNYIIWVFSPYDEASFSFYEPRRWNSLPENLSIAEDCSCYLRKQNACFLNHGTNKCFKNPTVEFTGLFFWHSVFSRSGVSTINFTDLQNLWPKKTSLTSCKNVFHGDEIKPGTEKSRFSDTLKMPNRKIKSVRTTFVRIQ